MDDLDQRLQNFYARKSLDKPTSESLVSLCDIAVDTASRPVGKPPAGVETGAEITRWWFGSPLWRLAGVAAAGLVLFVFTSEFHDRGSRVERTDRTIREAAMNHAMRLELEHVNRSLTALSESMNRLPFSLSMPERLDGKLELIGSRYCSLSGQLAAHVKFRDLESGQPVSLFITAIQDDFVPMQGQSTQLAGVDVELWQEKGLFYAMASR